jgi:MoxR-like ATPase
MQSEVLTLRVANAIIANASKVFLGKLDVIKMAVVALFANGHILIEDVPGAGKTLLARALARAIGGTFRRIQFTSDLLPSDIVGVNIYSQKSEAFRFHEGPVFANVVLADEINRASPRTQSALLEAMSERQITTDNMTRPLPAPFIVIATQNPFEHHGTYPLPESQMDRFLMCLSIGYPSREIEKLILEAEGFGDKLDSLVSVVTSPEEIVACQEAASKVTVSQGIMDYALDLVARTRTHPGLEVGVSTRGAIGLISSAKALACVEGRTFCIPDDVKMSFVVVCAHRCVPKGGTGTLKQVKAIILDIIQNTPVPGD